MDNHFELSFKTIFYLSESGVGGGDVVDGKGKGKGKGQKRGSDALWLKDFTLEYAKSSRSICRGCNLKIMKVSASYV